LFITILLVILLAFALGGLGKLVSKKALYDRELQRSFECGFPTLKESRLSFSLHFFLVALVFAIFDVEILILFPFIVDTSSYLQSHLSSVYSALIFVLTLGLINE
jgi:NADH:ubiquinone oxidoreductase subunit 3 (subunit A)